MAAKGFGQWVGPEIAGMARSYNLTQVATLTVGCVIPARMPESSVQGWQTWGRQ